MESPQLDHAMLCDCATKDYQVCDLCQIVKPAVEQLRAQVDWLKDEIAVATYAMPKTFYTDRTLAIRIGLMAEGWNRAVLVNKELEARVGELEMALRTWKNMMANPNYDLGEMASEFNAIVREVLP